MPQAEELFTEILTMVESGNLVLDAENPGLLPIAGGGYVAGPLGALYLVTSKKDVDEPLSEEQLKAEALKYGLSDTDVADITAGFLGTKGPASAYYKIGRKLRLAPHP